MSHSPFFSICVPTYNAQRYIRVCLASVSSQSFSEWELIVCDDCSTDSTIDEINQASEGNPRLAERLTVVEMEENSGPFLARRRAFDVARGEFVICLDADDELVKDSVLSSLHEILVSSCCDVLMFNMTDRREGGRRLVNYDCLAADSYGFVPKDRFIAAFASDFQQNNLATKVIRRNCLGHGCYAFSKGLRMCEDRLEMVGVLRKAELFFLYNEICYYYRPNSDSTTRAVFSFTYCEQQSNVEYEVCSFLGSQKKYQCLIPALELNSLVLIAHDMRRLANTGTLKSLSVEMRRLAEIPWFARCLSAACPSGLRADIRIRIMLLKDRHYYLAALFSKMLDTARRLSLRSEP